MRKIQNTSKRSGGAGIKLKNKKSNIFVNAAVILIAAYLLIMLLDFIARGRVADAFSNLFLLEVTRWDSNREMDVVYQVIDWNRLKWMGILIFLIAVLILYLVVRWYVKSRKEKMDVEVAALMEAYMKQEITASAFPNDYHEIKVQVLQVKNEMEHQAQLMREETTRKNDMITYLAHDLKTPLASVVGYLSLLNEASDLPTEQRMKYLGITLDKAYRLEQLINEFFDITRYNLQNITIEKEAIDLNFMLMQMADEFYPILNDAQMEIKLEMEEELIVKADAAKLARVFHNILRNAVAYGMSNSVIRLTAGRESGWIMIRFSNQGKTIPEEKLEMIFDKFFRVDQARGTKGGAGLGLAIAKEIIHLHQGKISAESRDGVTTFTVMLPGEAECETVSTK